MDNEDLQSQIDELKRRLDARDRQQVTFPLDEQSLKVLDKYYMHIVSELVTVGGAAGLVTFDYIGRQEGRTINGQQGSGFQEFIVSKNVYVPYTVNVTSNVITVNAYYENNMRINVLTTDTPPAPLIAGVDYFVINSTGTTFQLSLTAGGAAIDITNTGTGRQFLYSYGF